MMERARRLLTLETKHEQAIHSLCSVASSVVWTLKNGSDAEKVHIAEVLDIAWRKVSQEVMP